MKFKLKDILVCGSFAVVVLSFFIFSIFQKDQLISQEERRYLTQFPKMTVNSILNKEFFSELDEYLVEQFPLRQDFRKLKTFTNNSVFHLNDKEGVITKDGHIFKMDYNLDEESVINAASMYNSIRDKYFKDSNVFYTIIPDKNYFGGEIIDFPKMDYNHLIDLMKNKTDNMEYIDIIDKLSLENYYKTDLHWKQETLTTVADSISTRMIPNRQSMNTYSTSSVGDFYGAYFGEAAKNLKPDKLRYLTNETINKCKVFDFEKNKTLNIYNKDDFENVDPYDFYLGGAKPLLKIDNPSNPNGKTLYIFRDSFGSSIAPLLVEEYSTIVLVDLRYINHIQFERFIKPQKDSDVLFMYNSSILNKSSVICNFFR